LQFSERDDLVTFNTRNFPPVIRRRHDGQGSLYSDIDGSHKQGGGFAAIPVNGQHEVIGMSGDIALYQGKQVVHTHMVVGNPDGTTRAGHVLAAYASPTLEVMVTVDPITMQKRFDPATDLTLIDPTLKQPALKQPTVKQPAVKQP
jgi:Plants and Prokaryotes Conserved (PCC) domain